MSVNYESRDFIDVINLTHNFTNIPVNLVNDDRLTARKIILHNEFSVMNTHFFLNICDVLRLVRDQY